MFSEALRMLDENTVHYMIDELQKERDKAVAALSEKDAALSEKDSVISEKNAALSKKDAEIVALKAKLSALNK